MNKATFAAGCFWGVEARFRTVSGVIDVICGYTGGHLLNPTYEMVCTGTTGHAEAVEITFDPTEISYTELLEVFWDCHDPTSWHRQGPDHGSQYRSAIFFHTKQQGDLAMESKDLLQASDRYKKTIVTEIMPAGIFYPAEEYHQRYLERRQ